MDNNYQQSTGETAHAQQVERTKGLVIKLHSFSAHGRPELAATAGDALGNSRAVFAASCVVLVESHACHQISKPIILKQEAVAARLRVRREDFPITAEKRLVRDAGVVSHPQMNYAVSRFHHERRSQRPPSKMQTSRFAVRPASDG
jgi:hypothetical protein